MREKIENILRNQEPDRNKLSMEGKEQIVPHSTAHCSGNERLQLQHKAELTFTGHIKVFPDRNSDKPVWVLFSYYVPYHIT